MTVFTRENVAENGGEGQLLPVLFARMKAAVSFFEVGDREAEIFLRGGQVGVSEHFLNVPDARAVADHVRRARVPERVRRHGMLDARQPGVLLDHRGQRVT